MDVSNSDIVVMAGGRGTRMGPLAAQYGCKSLIPVNGVPAIEYVIRALVFVTMGQGRIFLCIERPDLYAPMQKLVERLGVQKQAWIYLNPRLKGTIHSLFLLRDVLRESSVFVMYGHQPVDPAHLARMLRQKEGQTLVTLYRTTSNISRKISVVDSKRQISELLQGGEEEGLNNSEYYIDVPYRFPWTFVKEQGDEYVRSHEAVQRWLNKGNKVKGLVAHFPHEFHFPEELPEVAQFTSRIQRKLSL